MLRNVIDTNVIGTIFAENLPKRCFQQVRELSAEN